MNKKTISRAISFMIILLLISAIGTFYYVKLEIQEKNEKINLFSLIPKDCEAILEINNTLYLFQSLHNTAFSDLYKKQQISDLLNLIDDKFNYFNEQETHGLSGQINHLLISFHSPGNPEDQVIYGHLGNKDKDYINSLLKQKGNINSFHKEIEYNKEKILIYPIDNEKFLACYFHKEFYAISFQKRLIEKVIDTYKHHTPSIQNDSTFTLLSYVQKKPTNSIYLYARSLPLSNWTEFNIRIHNQSIYMIGSCIDSSMNSFAQTITKGEKIELVTSQSLPEKTSIFYQFSVSDSIPVSFRDLKENNSISPNYTCNDFIKKYTQKTINYIEFEGNDSTKLHRIFAMPLSQSVTGIEPEWNNFAGFPFQFKQINKKNYNLYSIKERSFFNKYIPPISNTQEEIQPLYATLFDQQLLISNQTDDLISYIQLLTVYDKEDSSWKELADLARSSNFTLLTDMKQLFKHSHTYTEYIPSFIIRHKSFFQYFTFSLQLTEVQNNINANIILTYKGV